jgi:hypothetical protein
MDSRLPRTLFRIKRRPRTLFRIERRPEMSLTEVRCVSGAEYRVVDKVVFADVRLERFVREVWKRLKAARARQDVRTVTVQRHG